MRKNLKKFYNNNIKVKKSYMLIIDTETIGFDYISYNKVIYKVGNKIQHSKLKKIKEHKFNSSSGELTSDLFKPSNFDMNEFKKFLERK